MQVTIDIQVSPETVKEQWTAEVANTFIEEAVAESGLTPFAHRAVEDLPDRLIFFQMIAESHVSGHLMREHGLGWIDVFSCKPVNALAIGKIAQRHFTRSGDGVRVRVLGRGLLPQGGTDGAHDSGANPQGQAH